MTGSYPVVDEHDETLREALDLQREAEKRRFRHLRAFVEAAWPIVEPEREFSSNWHIDHLCVLLEAITAGKIKRCIINVPPGTMKSLLVSVFWPAWEWTQFPSLRYLTAAYGSHLTLRDNDRFKTIVTSPWYQELWPTEFSKLGKERIDSTRRGWRIATSVNGVGTGEHPDRIIIDDPTTADQARSDTERESANLWFDRTISSRGVTRNTRIVVIMQRLHTRDLTGHLLAKGGDWYHVCFPMEYRTREVNVETKQVTYEPSKLDPRRVKGELMWPSLYTPQIVKTLKLDLGPYGAAGQLQQAPSPEGGGLFQRVWARFVDIAPRCTKIVRGWDTAATEDGGDWTVGVKIGELNGDYYIMDVARKQLSPKKVDDLILATAEMDGWDCAQREEKEGGSAGKAVIEARLKLLRRFDYKGVQVSGDKVTRSKPFRSQFEGGRVYLVRASWNETYLSELEYFPVGDHDDQVDGSSCAYNELVAEPEAVSVTWGTSDGLRVAG